MKYLLASLGILILVHLGEGTFQQYDCSNLDGSQAEWVFEDCIYMGTFNLEQLCAADKQEDN